MKRYAWCIAVLGVGLAAWTALLPHVDAADDEGWISLFNGKDLDGWKANENPGSFTVQDGAIVAHVVADKPDEKHPISHLFYEGPVADHNFRDFDFRATVMTRPGANSGIYFHTKYQDRGFPKAGYEVQVNNTHKDPKKTGGLYAVRDVFEAPAKDNEWFVEEISVRGKHVTIKVDGKILVDWTEPEGFQAKGMPERKIDHGTFALQGHDPKSEVLYKNIEVRPVRQ